MNLPVPNPPRPAQDMTMGGLFASVKDELLLLERSLAGYNTMTTVLRQLTEGLQPGERKKGIPLIEYGGSVNEKDVTKVSVDLNKLNPTHVPYVLSPICAAHAAEMLTSLRKINGHVALMLQQVEAAMQPPPAQAPPEPMLPAAGPVGHVDPNLLNPGGHIPPVQ